MAFSTKPTKTRYCIMRIKSMAKWYHVLKKTTNDVEKRRVYLFNVTTSFRSASVGRGSSRPMNTELINYQPIRDVPNFRDRLKLSRQR